MTRARQASTFLVALAAAATFVPLRDHYDWEDEPFLTALAGFCAAAAVAAALASLLLRARAARSALHGAVAAVLVPALVLVYYFPIKLGLCFVSDGCYQ